MKDYFILQIFTMATCTRKRGDFCVMLGITGKTSVGKSTLFEAPLTDICHVYVNDKGVGRFKIENKTVLFFHDVDVNLFVKSRDRDIIKTICRSEPTTVKIHSTITSVPPVHVFYTSNTNLFSHRLCGAKFLTTISSDVCVKPNNVEHINSMRFRFIECYCNKRPKIDPNWLPECGIFQRQHMILGLYVRVLEIMSRCTSPDFFYKPVQPHYVMAGLAKNAKVYQQIFNVSLDDKIKSILKTVIKNENQQNDVLKFF
jgi:hypothetical protein